MATSAPRILIVDDHAVVRQGLRMFLALDPELDVIGEAGDGVEALEQARRLHPDVVLMDLLMPRMDGVAATAAIRGELPDVEVIALTSVLEDAAAGLTVDAAGVAVENCSVTETKAHSCCSQVSLKRTKSGR